MFEHIDLVADERNCRICGMPLLGDPDDQPFPPLGPMDGECYRSQQMDDEIDWAREFHSDNNSDNDDPNF